MRNAERVETKLQPPVISYLTYYGGLALLLLDFGALIVLDKDLSAKGVVLYWPLGVMLLHWLTWIAVPLAVASIFLWAKSNMAYAKKPPFVLGIVVAACAIVGCLFVNYLFAWDGSSMSAVGTATWGKQTYNVARISQFDERDKYYLGECGETRFRCNFREVFETYTGYGSYHARQVSLHVGQGALTVKMDDMAVYVFDGKVGRCDTGPSEEIYCVGENP